MRREIVKHFGRIPPVMHTDHGTDTRLVYLPLQRIEAKHYRWYAEVVQGAHCCCSDLEREFCMSFRTR